MRECLNLTLSAGQTDIFISPQIRTSLSFLHSLFLLYRTTGTFDRILTVRHSPKYNLFGLSLFTHLASHRFLRSILLAIGSNSLSHLQCLCFVICDFSVFQIKAIIIMGAPPTFDSFYSWEESKLPLLMAKFCCKLITVHTISLKILIVC